MALTLFRHVAAGALLLSAIGANATLTATVFNRALMGSSNFGAMGYEDKDGNFVEVTGQQILGAWVDVQFTPARRADLVRFTMEMLVPVEGARDVTFRVGSRDLIPTGGGRFRAMITTSQFNGTVRPGRYSIETFGVNANGEHVPLNGQLEDSSGFYFLVTRP